jgi:hypothetical protein
MVWQNVLVKRKLVGKKKGEKEPNAEEKAQTVAV